VYPAFHPSSLLAEEAPRRFAARAFDSASHIPEENSVKYLRSLSLSRERGEKEQLGATNVTESPLRLSSAWKIALHEGWLSAARRRLENAEVVCGLLRPARGTIQIFVSVIRDFMVREQE